MERYKDWVRRNHTFIESTERFLQLLTWFPDRFTSSEYAYEGLSTAVGLLGLWHENIIYGSGSTSDGGRNWSVWLAAVQQVATLAEIRGIHMEQVGKMSRCAPDAAGTVFNNLLSKLRSPACIASLRTKFRFSDAQFLVSLLMPATTFLL